MATEKKPHLISVVLPAFNEETLLESSLEKITRYLKSEGSEYSWELLVINDGSSDRTGEIADALAVKNKLLRVIHHPVNLNLGRALQTGFKNAQGDIIVVLDLDLSYSPDHIMRLVSKQIETDADVVIASPYMKEGKVSGVPFKRALMSKVVNHFMRMVTHEHYHTFTGMVRAYKSGFIKNLNLKTVNYEINPEVLYKASILRARVVEIPAHLDWSFQNGMKGKRTSSMRIRQSFYSSLMAGFIFRPYAFFITSGFILLLVSAYIIGWIIINTIKIMPTVNAGASYFDDKFSQAIGLAFQMRPHAFYIGGITLILAVQILSLGFLSLQKKRYFEELFHLNSSIARKIKSNGSNNNTD
jgi:dolichol-phosphate mannosyltransferase